MADLGKEGRIFMWVLKEHDGMMWNEFIFL
jgi:hypothetical protein